MDIKQDFFDENGPALPEDGGKNASLPPTVPSRLRNQPLSDYLARNLVVQATYGATAGFFLYFSMYPSSSTMMATPLNGSTQE
jgi:hypothetical protein